MRHAISGAWHSKVGERGGLGWWWCAGAGRAGKRPEGDGWGSRNKTHQKGYRDSNTTDVHDVVKCVANRPVAAGGLPSLSICSATPSFTGPLLCSPASCLLTATTHHHISPAHGCPPPIHPPARGFGVPSPPRPGPIRPAPLAAPAPDVSRTPPRGCTLQLDLHHHTRGGIRDPRTSVGLQNSIHIRAPASILHSARSASQERRPLRCINRPSAASRSLAPVVSVSQVSGSLSQGFTHTTNPIDAAAAHHPSPPWPTPRRQAPPLRPPPLPLPPPAQQPSRHPLPRHRRPLLLLLLLPLRRLLRPRPKPLLLPPLLPSPPPPPTRESWRPMWVVQHAQQPRNRRTDPAR